MEVIILFLVSFFIVILVALSMIKIIAHRIKLQTLTLNDEISSLNERVKKLENLK